MDKTWVYCVKLIPWLLLILPIQLLVYELTTTPYLALVQIILAMTVILYRTSYENERLIRLVAILLYSILLGVVVETTPYELYTTYHTTWVLMITYLVCMPRVHGEVASLNDYSPPMSYSRVDGIVLAIVFAISFGIRIYNIEQFPIFGGDEANAALYGIAVRDGVAKNLLGSGWYEFPAMWFVIPAFTHSLLADGMIAVRIHAVIVGSLTCMAIVWALRPLYSIWIAAIAGITLAFFGVHIFFSQIGLNNIYDGFFLVVLFGLLIRQLPKPSDMRWNMIGIVIGVALYGYTSARLLPVIFTCWIIVRVVQLRNAREELVAQLRGFLTVTLVAGIVAAPLLVHYFYRPENMVAPLVRFSFISMDESGLTLFERVANDSGRSIPVLLWDHFVASVSALTIGVSDGWYEYSSGLTGRIMLIPFAIGSVYVLLRRSEWVMRLALFTIFLFMIMSMLSHPVGAGQRLVTAMPLVAMMVAVGCSALYIFLQRHIKQWKAIICVVVMLSLGTYVNYDAHFLQFMQYQGGIGDPNSSVANFYGQHARRFPKGTIVDNYISPDFQQDANASINYNSRHLDYREISPELPPRADAQVILVPIGRESDVDIPANFMQTTFVIKPSNEVLLTITYHPDLHPYVADLVIDRIFPPRFEE